MNVVVGDMQFIGRINNEAVIQANRCVGAGASIVKKFMLPNPLSPIPGSPGMLHVVYFPFEGTPVKL